MLKRSINAWYRTNWTKQARDGKFPMATKNTAGMLSKFGKRLLAKAEEMEDTGDEDEDDEEMSKAVAMLRVLTKAVSDAKDEDGEDEDGEGKAAADTKKAVTLSDIPRLFGKPKKSLANQFCRDSSPFHDPWRLPRP
jgi:hypothetical protein